MSDSMCHQDMQTFWRMLTGGFCGGQPLLPVLKSIAESLPAEPMGRVVHELCKDINDGCNLSNAMSRHPSVFSPAHISLIDGGERLGIVDKVLLLILEATWRCPTCSGLRFPEPGGKCGA